MHQLRIIRESPGFTATAVEPSGLSSANLCIPRRVELQLVCGWHHKPSDMGDGLYDNGEQMCGGFVWQFVR